MTNLAVRMGTAVWPQEWLNLINAFGILLRENNCIYIYTFSLQSVPCPLHLFPLWVSLVLLAPSLGGGFLGPESYRACHLCSWTPSWELKEEVEFPELPKVIIMIIIIITFKGLRLGGCLELEGWGVVFKCVCLCICACAPMHRCCMPCVWTWTSEHLKRAVVEKVTSFHWRNILHRSQSNFLKKQRASKNEAQGTRRGQSRTEWPWALESSQGKEWWRLWVPGRSGLRWHADVLSLQGTWHIVLGAQNWPGSPLRSGSAVTSNAAREMSVFGFMEPSVTLGQEPMGREEWNRDCWLSKRWAKGTKSQVCRMSRSQDLMRITVLISQCTPKIF